MITLRMDGEKKIISAFEKITAPESRAGLMDELASFGVSSTQQKFIDQRDPDGKSWSPSRRAQEQGGKTLQNSNRLFQSLSSEATQAFAAWGSNVIYAGIHQLGGTIKAKNGKKLVFKGYRGFVSVSQVEIPARPYLGISKDDESEIEHIVHDWMRGSLQ